MEDGLYLNDVWVFGADSFALSLQGFDIAAPGIRKASFTNSFTIEDTLTVRNVTQGAEQIDSYGKRYSLIPATLIDEGEVLFSGVAQLTKFVGGWSVTLLSSKLGFFDKIKNKSIQALDLHDLNHKWDLETISTFINSVQGITYPIIDPGVMENDVIPSDTITPSVFLHTLARRIIREAGYTPKGNWLNDDLIKRVALPYVGSGPKAHEQDWIDERTARVTTNIIELGKSCDTIIPFEVDNDFANGWVDGIIDESLPDLVAKKPLDNYNTTTHEYICPDNMTLKVTAWKSWNVTILSGTCESILIILKNGEPVGEAVWTKNGTYNLVGRTDSLTVEKEVKCQKGDRIKIQYRFGRRTLIGKYYVELSFNSANVWASFIPLDTVSIGTEWPVAQNLPDISCTNIILTCCYLLGADPYVDEITKEVELRALDEVRKRGDSVQDWTNRLDEAYEPELTALVDGLGQKNLFKWTEQQNKNRKGYGDGVIYTEAESYPEEETLLEMPFSAVVTSNQTLSGYGSPLLIPTRSWSGTGDSRSVSASDAPACLILVEPAYTKEVKTQRVTDEGEVVPATVYLTGAWFGRRPGPLQNADNRLTLCFSALKGQIEQPIIDRSYKVLQNALKRPVKFVPYLYLSSLDIGTWDQRTPVRLRNVRAGSHDIDDLIFYVNLISSYRSGLSCAVTLIPIDELDQSTEKPINK